MDKEKWQKRALVVALLIAVIIILLLLLIRCKPDNHAGVIDIKDIKIKPIGSAATETDISTQTDISQISITFGGLREYYVDASNPDIFLYNPIANKFSDELQIYMIFEIYCNEYLLAQTEPIAPGMTCYITVYSYFDEPGDYEITVVCSPVDMNTNLIYNGVQHKTILHKGD